jgi:amino acid transporter
MNLTEVTDLTSIGTLFAFVLVCGGVLILNESQPNLERRFRTPYINARFLGPAIFLGVWALLYAKNPDFVRSLFSATDPSDPSVQGWDEVKHRIPLYLYLLLAVILLVQCVRKSLSLIPVLGVLTCGYLMTELGWTNWVRFLLWLAAGLVLYFFYGYHHSKLGKNQPPAAA